MELLLGGNYVVFDHQIFETLILFLTTMRSEWWRGKGRGLLPWEVFIKDIELREMDRFWVYICMPFGV